MVVKIILLFLKKLCSSSKKQGGNEKYFTRFAETGENDFLRTYVYARKILNLK